MEQGDNAGLIYDYQRLISIESKGRENANVIIILWNNTVYVKLCIFSSICVYNR